jgi:hypothetical protein
MLGRLTFSAQNHTATNPDDLTLASAISVLDPKSSAVFRQRTG